MFYSTDLLCRNDAKFAAIWLASVYGKNIKKKLTRRQITAVNIPQACLDVLHPHVRLSLRLQSNLMVGILRVYYEQVSHFCEMTKRAWRDLRMTFNVDMRLIDLQNNVLSKNACTLPDPLLDNGHFPILTSHRFSMDDYEEFIRADFHSPSSSTTSSSPLTPIQPHMLQSPRELITMPDITLPDIREKPIEVPEEEDLTPEILPLDDEVIGDIESPSIQEDQPPEEAEVRIVDATSGELRIEDTSETGKSQREEMVTPNGQIIEPVVPERPRKRRRGQPVDIIRKLSDEKIKRNHLNVSQTLRKKIIDLPLQLTADELFNNPTAPELRLPPLFKLWRQNAIPQPIPDDEVPDFFSSFDESDLSPEEVRENGTQVSGYDQSGSHLIPPTPEAGSPTPIQSKVDPDLPEIARPSPDYPTIHEVTMEEDIAPTISPIVETAEEEDESFEQELQSHLAEVTSEKDETTFSEVFPVSKTKKRMAAKGLFQLLEWHRTKAVVLSQPGASFSEINIKRGPNFDLF